MSEPLLQVEHLKKYFKTPRGVLHAVDDVGFTLDAGKTLGVVGESGCGKSTRDVLCSDCWTQQRVRFSLMARTSLTQRGRPALGTAEGQQIIFQDPFSSAESPLLRV